MLLQSWMINRFARGFVIRARPTLSSSRFQERMSGTGFSFISPADLSGMDGRTDCISTPSPDVSTDGPQVSGIIWL